jgi:hypothetical protein
MELNTQGVHVVQMIPAVSGNTSSYISSATTYISMKGYHKALFVADLGSGAAVTFKFRQAKTVAGGSQKALLIDGYYENATAVASASVTSDTFIYTAYATGSSSQATAATNSTTYVFPVDAKALSVASSFDCIGIAHAAAVRPLTVTAFLYPRYAQQIPMPTKAD